MFDTYVMEKVLSDEFVSVLIIVSSFALSYHMPSQKHLNLDLIAISSSVFWTQCFSIWRGRTQPRDLFWKQ